MKDDKINNLRQELMDKIDDIKQDVGDIKVEIAKLPEILADKFDTRYANKDTEIALKRLNWLVITAVCGALLALIVSVK